MRFLYHHRTQAQDGQAVHVRAFLRALEECGHEVFEVGLVKHASRGAAPRARWSWVTRAPRFLRELAEYGYSGVAKSQLKRDGARFEPDVLYERYAFGNFGGVQAARHLGCPLVLEVNAPLVRELAATRGLAFPGLARRVERFVLEGADLVCAVSGVLRDELVAAGAPAERVLVTPNGVRLEDYDGADREAMASVARRALGLDASAPVLGFVGYVRSWHRLDLAVEALARPGLADARLVVVGEGPAEPELRARAAALGVAERVHFAGARPHEEIPRLLPAFDVGLLPAINAYASPLKLHEYMAAGLAVVAPDQANLREVLRDGVDGCLVPPGDGAALGAVLEELVAAPERRAALGVRARSTVQRLDLTWRANVRRVVASLEARAVPSAGGAS